MNATNFAPRTSDRLARIFMVVCSVVMLLKISPDRASAADPDGPDPSALSYKVRQVVGLAGKNRTVTSATNRYRFVRSLSTGKLSDADARAIEWYLGQNLSKSPADIPSRLWRQYANDLFTVLRSQPGRAGRTQTFLVSVFRDADANIVLRDYALQHLVDLYPDLRDEKGRGEIRSCLKEGTAMPGTIAGSALLGWRKLATEHPLEAAAGKAELAAVGERAVKLASDKKVAAASRATAFAVCAELRLARAIAPARTTALDQKQPIPLRLAATSALRKIGGAEAERSLAELSAQKGLHPLLKANTND